jgi:uncharacterized protein (UPF0335 family)
MTMEGHNNPPDDAATHSFAKEQLRSIIERIEHVDGEIKGLQEGKKEIFQEASSAGFDVKALRTIIRMRKQDANERAEAETILDTYLQALGMI